MFEFLQFKVSLFQNDVDRECGLVIDEMSITPKHVYNFNKNNIGKYNISKSRRYSDTCFNIYADRYS